MNKTLLVTAIVILSLAMTLAFYLGNRDKPHQIETPAPVPIPAPIPAPTPDSGLKLASIPSPAPNESLLSLKIRGCGIGNDGSFLNTRIENYRNESMNISLLINFYIPTVKDLKLSPKEKKVIDILIGDEKKGNATVSVFHEGILVDKQTVSIICFGGGDGGSGGSGIASSVPALITTPTPTVTGTGTATPAPTPSPTQTTASPTPTPTQTEDNDWFPVDTPAIPRPTPIQTGDKNCS